MLSREQLVSLKKRAREGMTVARLRTFKGFENITEQAAKELIYTLRLFAQNAVQQLNRLSKEHHEQYREI